MSNSLSFPGAECDAAAKVFAKIQESGRIPAVPSSAAADCAALSAAEALISDASGRERLRNEFIALTGAFSCGMLAGRRCEYYSSLAAELVCKYRRRDNPDGKIRVMLIGDSICGNYQGVVCRELGDRYDVVCHPENGRFAKYTLNQLSGWFNSCGEPDLIHWNNGLWDSAVVCREDGMFTSPEEYLFYMSKILRELKKHTPHVIFATTTPVLDGSANQHLEFIDRLNAVIVPYLHEQGVRINDLYALVKPRGSELLRNDCIHLNSAGCEVCGKAVAEAIRMEWAAENVPER